MKVKMKKNHQIGEVKEIRGTPRHSTNRFVANER